MNVVISRSTKFGSTPDVKEHIQHPHDHHVHADQNAQTNRAGGKDGQGALEDVKKPSPPQCREAPGPLVHPSLDRAQRLVQLRRGLGMKLGDASDKTEKEQVAMHRIVNGRVENLEDVQHIEGRVDCDSRAPDHAHERQPPRSLLDIVQQLLRFRPSHLHWGLRSRARAISTARGGANEGHLAKQLGGGAADSAAERHESAAEVQECGCHPIKP
mmetsp:Transcript_22319/g.63898  ORF Transcript_22319/g.63898 Transcript_22319/m.63898 type:complete len:214 (+) Transcript_22319:82-723(+)